MWMHKSDCGLAVTHGVFFTYLKLNKGFCRFFTYFAFIYLILHYSTFFQTRMKDTKQNETDRQLVNHQNSDSPGGWKRPQISLVAQKHCQKENIQVQIFTFAWQPQHKLFYWQCVFSLNVPIYLISIFIPIHWKLFSLQITSQVHHSASGVKARFSVVPTQGMIYISYLQSLSLSTISAIWLFPYLYKARTMLPGLRVHFQICSVWYVPVCVTPFMIFPINCNTMHD